MPDPVQSHAVRLEFAPNSPVALNLSGAAASVHGGRHWLWVAGDEGCGIDRLALLPTRGSERLRFGDSHHFGLAELLDLPGQAADEADIEGLAIHDGWLWLTGSHGLKRKSPKRDKTDADNARRLAKTRLDANRRLLARIPLVQGPDGQPRPVRRASDGRRAMRLEGDAVHNALTRWLAEDALLGPFLAIPGKDNGLDIEGLALCGERLVLGLRGPVLRGWACVLVLAVVPGADDLALASLDAAGTRVAKHFLPLDGLGVRDLAFDGDDLLVLAGPTMVLDADIRLYRWRGAGQALRNTSAAVGFAPPLALCRSLPHGRGCNRAEALCRWPAEAAGPQRAPAAEPSGWLVLYDAPGADRLAADGSVSGDWLAGPV